MESMPVLFVSHGAPSLLLDRGPAYDFLRQLGPSMPLPQAIVCVSAHWETPHPAVTAGIRPETIYDFSGFPDALYDIYYPAPGDRPLAQSVCERLGHMGLECTLDERRGLDHGAWIPLSLMYPEADIPVIQLSLQHATGPEHHWKIGQALQPLRHQGVLILGSGGATHNLSEVGRHRLAEPPETYASEFDDWLARAVEIGDVEALLDYKSVAPHARHNHPTDEHFMPLFVALGAAGAGAKGKRLHQGFTYGVLSMAAYGWGGKTRSGIM